MFNILAIEPQPRKKKNYTLTLDDGRAFSVHEEVIVRYRLKSGMQLSEDQLQTWIWEANVKIAQDLALHYLGYRVRTRKQLCDYLERKGFDPPVIEEAADKMEEYRFIDDREYARNWVQSKKYGSPAGRRKIAYELQNKGISHEITEEALTGLSEEEELKQALKLAEKYKLKYQNLPVHEGNAKIAQALQRRGFDWGLVNQVLNQLMRDTSCE
ncbi:MAG TPA: hypothetical protein DIW17_08260 [Clostridiales bacterium]|mgnify:FL=1|nr:RecX family transcriptional regulator [Clostridia bacterium]HCS73853.1 hypothetical protein [Clostridiales bacterium]